jgi:hypothetical protein
MVPPPTPDHTSFSFAATMDIPVPHIHIKYREVIFPGLAELEAHLEGLADLVERISRVAFEPGCPNEAVRVFALNSDNIRHDIYVLTHAIVATPEVSSLPLDMKTVYFAALCLKVRRVEAMLNTVADAARFRGCDTTFNNPGSVLETMVAANCAEAAAGVASGRLTDPPTVFGNTPRRRRLEHPVVSPLGDVARCLVFEDAEDINAFLEEDQERIVNTDGAGERHADTASASSLRVPQGCVYTYGVLEDDYPQSPLAVPRYDVFGA